MNLLFGLGLPAPHKADVMPNWPNKSEHSRDLFLAPGRGRIIWAFVLSYLLYQKDGSRLPYTHKHPGQK